jgi:short-subunit dehydrogenase
MTTPTSSSGQGLVAAVTGASSGIGAVFAERLAQRGYDLLLLARRRDRLERNAATWREKYGVAVEEMAVDLASAAGIDGAAERLRHEPRLAFLVNNAGFGSRGLFWEASLESQEQMHLLHVMATMKLSHAALGGMVARRRGAVVNVSSVAAFTQSRQNVSYCSTKAWINSFTFGLHLELRSAQSPVKVQALCPGFTYSEFHDVLKVDRSRIRFHWMTAEYVVDESLRRIEQGDDPIVVPNWRYRLVTSLVPRLPLSWKRYALERYGNSRPE